MKLFYSMKKSERSAVVHHLAIAFTSHTGDSNELQLGGEYNLKRNKIKRKKLEAGGTEAGSYNSIVYALGSKRVFYHAFSAYKKPNTRVFGLQFNSAALEISDAARKFEFGRPNQTPGIQSFIAVTFLSKFDLKCELEDLSRR